MSSLRDDPDATSLDDRAIEWPSVAEATFVIRQRFRYDYPGPIADLQHRLIVVPRERHGDQQRIASRLDVAPHATVRDARDAYGNSVASVFARRVERSIEFSHRSIVTRAANVEHYVAESVLDDPEFVRATPLTACDAALRSAARTLRDEHRDDVALADAVNAYVFEQMQYVEGVTDVETTAALAFAKRAGVCQDYAHVALAIARRAGLCARYVSGHMIGEGGTHAWIEIAVRAGTRARVIAYDPTHGRRADLRYVVVAIGRDYSDVAPTSGVFTAPYSGELHATKRVSVTRLRYAPAATATALPDIAAS